MPSAGQLMLISDLRDCLDREEQEIRRNEGERKAKDGGYLGLPSMPDERVTI
jgi:hypothetical protein